MLSNAKTKQNSSWIEQAIGFDLYRFNRNIASGRSDN